MSDLNIEVEIMVNIVCSLSSIRSLLLSYNEVLILCKAAVVHKILKMTSHPQTCIISFPFSGMEPMNMMRYLPLDYNYVTWSSQPSNRDYPDGPKVIT